MEVKDFFSRPHFFHFAWPSHYQINFVLPVCFLIATLIHVGAIFLFEIAYQEEGGTIPRTAEVAVLHANSPEYKKIAHWLEGNDPALLSSTQPADVDFEQVFQTPYWPTFDLATMHLQPSPAVQTGTSNQEVILPEDVVSNLVSDTAPVPSSPRHALPTHVEFQNSLGSRIPDDLPPAPNAIQSAEPAMFLTGVLPDGRIGFIYLQNESGINALDQLAMTYLRGLRLKKSAASDIQWGMVTFHWGIAPANPQKP